jgi:hypothetical protein
MKVDDSQTLWPTRLFIEINHELFGPWSILLERGLEARDLGSVAWPLASVGCLQLINRCPRADDHGDCVLPTLT